MTFAEGLLQGSGKTAVVGCLWLCWGELNPALLCPHQAFGLRLACGNTRGIQEVLERVERSRHFKVEAWDLRGWKG